MNGGRDYLSLTDIYWYVLSNILYIAIIPLEIITIKTPWMVWSIVFILDEHVVSCLMNLVWSPEMITWNDYFIILMVTWMCQVDEHIRNDLVGGFNPSEKNISQIGSSSQVLGKIKTMFQTTKQWLSGAEMVPELMNIWVPDSCNDHCRHPGPPGQLAQIWNWASIISHLQNSNIKPPSWGLLRSLKPGTSSTIVPCWQIGITHARSERFTISGRIPYTLFIYI